MKAVPFNFRLDLIIRLDLISIQFTIAHDNYYILIQFNVRAAYFISKVMALSTSS